MPMRSIAATLRGVRPSPQTFSRGNEALSTTVTSMPVAGEVVRGGGPSRAGPHHQDVGLDALRLTRSPRSSSKRLACESFHKGYRNSANLPGTS